MYSLPSTITLLVVIAHVQCGTLRQYGPDWLIPKPDPHVGSKRITAKSVFIAPSLDSPNVRCATGFREDGSGRCVKLVHVNQAAQLDFLLQRLNAMYGAPAANHSDKQPLQVEVAIPVEEGDGNNTSIPLKGEEMYSEALLPQGEVSVDLLAGTLNQQESTEEIAIENSTKEHQNEDFQEMNEASVLPDFGNESEDNQTNLMIHPNKEWFQVDEEPTVTLTSIDSDDEEDSVGITTVNYDNATASHVVLQDTLSSPHSVDAGIMANVTKNTSNVVKKETPLGDSSVSLSSESTSNHTFTETYAIETANVTGVQSVHNVNNRTEQVYHTSNHSTEMVSSNFTANGEKTESSEDESINEVHIKRTNISNVTSSKLNETKTSGESFSLTSSTSVASPTTEASTTLMPTRQQIVSNFTTQTSQIVTTTFATNESYGEPNEDSVKEHHDWEDSGEKVDSEKQGTNEDDYDYPIREVDVEAQVPDEYYTDTPSSGDVALDLHKEEENKPEMVSEGSANGGLLLSVNDSVKINSSESTVVGDDAHLSVETDLEDNGIGVNKTVSLNSTKPNEKTELDNGIINVSNSNETNFDKLASVNQTIETGVKTASEVFSNVSGQSVMKEETPDVLKADSTMQHVKIQPFELSEIVHSVPQQMQHQSVITPQHSVHVVYPQPIIEVLNVKQDPPHSYPTNVANQNEPITGQKDNINPPKVQLHNLNPIPNPLQNHNFNPLPQMPLIEKSPDIPPKYDGPPYRPLAPHLEIPRPYLHPHHRPYPQHHRPYPQHNPSPNGQGGFVRFPGDLVQPHHPHDEVNTVRFPQEDVRNNDKYSRWGNWRGNERRPEQNYWTGAQDSQYPQGTNQRNYWVDNRPNRRRPQPNFYY